jgi:uncharacterized membrane protein
VYNFLLVLHILTVIVGIGPMTLNGVYAVKAKKIGGPAQGGAMRVNFEVAQVAEKIIYLIPITGFALIGVGGDDRNLELSQTWLWLSIVLYVVSLGISHGVMKPSAVKMQAIGAKLASGQGTPEDGAQAGALQKRLAMGGMTLNLMLVVLVALMVVQPGR